MPGFEPGVARTQNENVSRYTTSRQTTQSLVTKDILPHFIFKTTKGRYSRPFLGFFFLHSKPRICKGLFPANFLDTL